jgi:FkbM family methyltransferase
MEDKKFESIEHEIIYNKMINYCNETNFEVTVNHPKNIGRINNYGSIDTMRAYKELYAHRLIKSHRKHIGNIIVFWKKVARRCLKWYINPITEQQTIFNNAALETVESLLEKLSNTELDNNNLLAKISELESQVSRIKGLENQVSKIAELENQLARITDLENQVEKINDTFKLELSNQRSFFEKKSYSQAGEDTILAYIFFALGFKNEEITYLDLGANHAKELSNTYYFYENGAKGVLVEANPKLIQELSFYRYNDVILNSLISEKENEEMDFYILSGDGLSTPDKEQALEACRINPNVSITNVIKVKSTTVNNIMEKYFGGISPKFISVDIEGNDLEIIKSIDLDKYRPLVIVVETIEYRPYLPINVKKYEVIEYLKTKDYIEYAFTGINSIFIDAKHMRNLGQEG